MRLIELLPTIQTYQCLNNLLERKKSGKALYINQRQFLIAVECVDFHGRGYSFRNVAEQFEISVTRVNQIYHKVIRQVLRYCQLKKIDVVEYHIMDKNAFDYFKETRRI